MQIQDLYDKYNLMPQLREHQLRVGGIVKLITNDHDSIITALVHDMGNIAKFEGLNTYWRKEQEKVWKLYGKEAHEATFAILRDAGLSELERSVREEGEFYQNILKLAGKYETYSDAAAYTLYGDSRVAINGVVSVMERVEDLEKRYGKARNDREWVMKLEEYVTKKSGRDVAMLGNHDVTPLFDELLTMTV